MKFIFLDIDGVLNTNLNNEIRSYNATLNSECINNLKYIIDMTKANIIISSSWRRSGIRSDTMTNLINQLNKRGIIISGYTPCYNKLRREEEIQSYIDTYSNKNSPPTSFVIIDDIQNMGHLNNHLVHCKPSEGLTDEKSELAISILNRVS